jgi:hypothetical protein
VSVPLGTKASVMAPVCAEARNLFV